MPEILFAILAFAILAALVVLTVRLAAQATAIRTLPDQFARTLEGKHRAMLGDLQ